MLTMARGRKTKRKATTGNEEIFFSFAFSILLIELYGILRLGSSTSSRSEKTKTLVSVDLGRAYGHLDTLNQTQ